MKKFISLILAVSVVIGCLGMSSNASSNQTVQVPVTYYQEDARSMLDEVNEWRATDPECKNYDGTTFNTGNTSPLTYDYGLEAVAIQRAVEIAMVYDENHTRPTGGSPFSCVVNGIATDGENIGFGHDTAHDMFVAFREDDAGYDGQGHRRNMLGADCGWQTFTSMAVACVMVNGTKYWVMEFGFTNSNAAATAAKSGTGTETVEYSPDVVSTEFRAFVNYARGNSAYGKTQWVGDEIDLSSYNVTVAYMLGNVILTDVTSKSQIEWFVDDASQADKVSIHGNSATVLHSSGTQFSIKARATYNGETAVANFQRYVTTIYGVSLKKTTAENETSGYLPDQPYSGSPITPEIKLTIGNITLTEGVDYEVSYYGNTQITSTPARAVITAVDGGTDFLYSKTIYFNIVSPDELSVQPTATPIPTVTVTPSPTSAPTSAPASAPVPKVSSFINRLYTLVLERNSEEAGRNYWISQIRNGMTGGEVAENFLYSEEFLNSGKSDSEFVEILYKVFFDRNSDSAGKTYWLNSMAAGMTKQEVIRGFINSTEWANVCLTYGIRSGGTGVPTITVEPNSDVIAFASRLYSTCLGRNPENAGLAYWSRELANMRVSGSEAAEFFFFSNEFQGLNLDNEEYVRRLYRTFMGREAEGEGFSYWVNLLKNGSSREEVFYGFAVSTEFREICADYGILV